MVHYFILAYPQLLPNTSRTSITLYAREGDNVKLPCPMDVSYFDQLNILWKINIFGQITQIPEPVNEDYSVTLSNVTVLRSGVYFCTARSKILSGGSSSLTGHQVNLIVQRKHGKCLTIHPFIYKSICLSSYCPSMYSYIH